MRGMERHAALPVVLTLLFLACDAELAAVAQNGLGPGAAASTPPGDERLSVTRRKRMFHEWGQFRASSNWSQNLEAVDLDTVFTTEKSAYPAIQHLMIHYAEKQDDRSTDESRGIFAKPRCNRTDGVGMDLEAPLPIMGSFGKSRCRKGSPLMFKNGRATGHLCGTELFTGNSKGVPSGYDENKWLHISVAFLHLVVHMLVGVYVGRLGTFKTWFKYFLRIHATKELTAADIYLSLKITPTAKDVTVNVSAIDAVRMRTDFDKMVLAQQLNTMLNAWMIYLAELFGTPTMESLMFYYFFLGNVFQFFADKAVMGQGSLKQLMSSQGFTHAVMYGLATYCHTVVSYNLSTMIFLLLTVQQKIFLRPWSRTLIVTAVDSILHRLFLHPIKQRWVFREALYKDVVTNEWVPTLRRRTTVLLVYVIFSAIVCKETTMVIRESHDISHCRMVYQKYSRPYTSRNESEKFAIGDANRFFSTLDYMHSGRLNAPPESLDKLSAWKNGKLEIKPVCELLGYREILLCSRMCRRYGGLDRFSGLVSYIKDNKDVSFRTVQQQVQRMAAPQIGAKINKHYQPMIANPRWDYPKFAEEPLCEVLNSGHYCCQEAGEDIYNPIDGNQRAKDIHLTLLMIQIVLNLGGIFKLGWLSFGNFAWNLSEEARLHVLPKAVSQWNRDFKPKYLTAEEFGERYSRFQAYMFFKKALMVEQAYKKNVKKKENLAVTWNKAQSDGRILSHGEEVGVEETAGP